MTEGTTHGQGGRGWPRWPVPDCSGAIGLSSAFDGLQTKVAGRPMAGPVACALSCRRNRNRNRNRNRRGARWCVLRAGPRQAGQACVRHERTSVCARADADIPVRCRMPARPATSSGACGAWLRSEGSKSRGLDCGCMQCERDPDTRLPCRPRLVLGSSHCTQRLPRGDVRQFSDAPWRAERSCNLTALQGRRASGGWRKRHRDVPRPLVRTGRPSEG